MVHCSVEQPYCIHKQIGRPRVQYLLMQQGTPTRILICESFERVSFQFELCLHSRIPNRSFIGISQALKLFGISSLRITLMGVSVFVSLIDNSDKWTTEMVQAGIKRWFMTSMYCFFELPRSTPSIKKPC